MTITKTLLLLRQTLARAKGNIRASALASSDGDAILAVSVLMRDIEQAIIEADREIERLEGGGHQRCDNCGGFVQGNHPPCICQVT